MISPEELKSFHQLVRNLALQCENLLTPPANYQPVSVKDPKLGDQKNQIIQGPNVRLIGSNLHVDDIIVPLASRPRTLALIAAFSGHGELSLSSNELVERVYYERGQEVSERLRHSSHQNLIKLTSRSRRFLEGAVNPHCGQFMIDWFYYDNTQKKWLFFRFYPSIKPQLLS